MKIAVCFFGQVKNYTSEMFNSFNLNIINQILSISNKLDYYIITFNNKRIFNPRNKEDHEINYMSIFDYFKFKSYEILDVESEEIKKVDELSKKMIEQFGCVWKSEQGISTTFGIRQLYCLEKIHLLIDKDYDKYIFVRPDVLFVNRMPIGFVDSEFDITVPSFHSAGGYNDRMAALNNVGIKVYCSRYQEIQKRIEKYHSEYFLKKICDKNNIKVKKIDNFNFKRVRSDGRLE